MYRIDKMFRGQRWYTIAWTTSESFAKAICKAMDFNQVLGRSSMRYVRADISMEINTPTGDCLTP